MLGAGEADQTTLPVPPEDPRSVLTTHTEYFTATHNSSSRGPDVFFWTPALVGTHPHTSTHVHT